MLDILWTAQPWKLWKIYCQFHIHFIPLYKNIFCYMIMTEFFMWQNFLWWKSILQIWMGLFLWHVQWILTNKNITSCRYSISRDGSFRDSEIYSDFHGLNWEGFFFPSMRTIVILFFFALLWFLPSSGSTFQ